MNEYFPQVIGALWIFFFPDFFLSEFHFVQTYSYILKFTIIFILQYQMCY